MRALIIGGGIIGLSTAYYLNRTGWKVTVIDMGDFSDNCSWGNAGYVCPSHFVPLAAPGIIKKGLKWMWNSSSPFYIQPRINNALMEWGLKFMKSASKRNVAQAAIPLRDIALISQHEYTRWAREFDFSYEHKGLVEIFQSEKNEDHAHHMVERAKELGLDTELLSYEELCQLEPHTQIRARGAVYFKCDAHLHPDSLMRGLLSKLREEGVELLPHEGVRRIERENNRVTRVITEKGSHELDHLVIAAGAWSREIASLVDIRLPLVAGRGYSITLEDSPYRLNHPTLLLERRVAITPMNGNKIRFGGTMEVTSIGKPPRIKRVAGILHSVKQYLPEFDIPMPAPDKIWYGYRPCSADGLPYIGRAGDWQNLVVATGHSMLGLSLGAGTGKLVSEIMNGETPSMDMHAFRVERFG
jgi:D-amino-acid dehydrogenase